MTNVLPYEHEPLDYLLIDDVRIRRRGRKMRPRKAIIGEMLLGSVDVEPGDSIESIEPVHRAIRGFGIKVEGENGHIQVGMKVIYTGHGHDTTRGRTGTVRWTRRNRVGKLEVRVDFHPGSRVLRDWDVFVGHETKFLNEVEDDIMLVDSAAAESLVRGGFGGIVAGVPYIEPFIPSWQPTIISVPAGTGVPTYKTPDQSAKTRDSVIDEAKSIISGDRAAAYGDINEDFGRIAKMWSAIFGIDIPVEKVALAMVAVKMSRLSQNLDHRDSWVDIIGYAGLGAEVADVKEKPNGNN